MIDPVICSPRRTPIGRFGGGLSDIRPDDLAALAIRGVLDAAASERGESERGGATGAPAGEALDGLVEEVILGCANQAGEDNRNVARMALLLAGLPRGVPGFTVNRLCASGLEAVNQAARMIRCGDAEVVLAGGVESMSRAPYATPRGSTTAKVGNLTIYDTSLGWRFPNPKLEQLFPLEAMGETAENLVERYGISRDAQDQFALGSHQKAVAADFSREILAVPRAASSRGVLEPLSRDEGPRPDSSLQALGKLQGAFRKGGSVTAGNSSTLNDGAAAMLVVHPERAAALGLRPVARILGMAAAGVDPRVMGIGPVPAIQKLLQRAGLTVADIDFFELNEAFAAQSIAVMTELGLPPEKVNVKGGAIALGHPLGSSGARILTTLTGILQERGGRYGIASLCVGVGQGVATLIERIPAGDSPLGSTTAGDITSGSAPGGQVQA